jgi:hypothetical protein
MQKQKRVMLTLPCAENHTNDNQQSAVCVHECIYTMNMYVDI